MSGDYDDLVRWVYIALGAAVAAVLAIFVALGYAIANFWS